LGNDALRLSSTWAALASAAWLLPICGRAPWAGDCPIVFEPAESRKRDRFEIVETRLPSLKVEFLQDR